MLGGEVGPPALRTTTIGRWCNTKGVYATEQPEDLPERICGGPRQSQSPLFQT
jgi:hypothetical protein